MDNSEIYFRAIEILDYEEINSLRDDYGVFSNIMGNKFYISTEREKQWIKKVIYDDSKTYWVICLKESHKILGFCSIIDIDWRNRKAYVGGVTISKVYRNKGYGIEALNFIMDYVFNELGLNKLSVEYKENNKVTEHGIKKLGFFKEQFLREHIYKQAKFQNVIIVSILKSEFNKKFKNEG